MTYQGLSVLDKGGVTRVMSLLLVLALILTVMTGTPEAAAQAPGPGEISNGGTTQSLLAKVNNADAANESGQVNAAINLLEAFRNQIDAQRGKHVSETAYLMPDSTAEQLLAVL